MNRKQISNGQIGWSQTMADRRTSLRIYGSNRHAKHRPKQNATRAGVQCWYPVCRCSMTDVPARRRAYRDASSSAVELALP